MTPSTAPNLSDAELLAELDRVAGRSKPTRLRRERISKLFPALAPDTIEIRISREARGRVTGWGVSCSAAGHGAMPVLAPSRAAARTAALTHAEDQHADERVRVVVGVK